VNVTVTIDKAGRLVLPKSIRESLRIGPGDELEIESAQDRIVLSPVRIHAGLEKEHGVWVYRLGKTANVSIPDLIDQERSRRTRGLLANRS
jgi:AbrB family looped-hinge helix DNA binding protein